MARNFCPVTGSADYVESVKSDGSIEGHSEAWHCITEADDGLGSSEDAMRIAHSVACAKSFHDITAGRQPHNVDTYLTALTPAQKEELRAKTVQHLASIGMRDLIIKPKPTVETEAGGAVQVEPLNAGITTAPLGNFGHMTVSDVTVDTNPTTGGTQ